MSMLWSTVADVIHVIGILLICKGYLKFRENKDDKYRYLKILIVTVISSLIINRIENQTIALIIYLLCIGTIIQICYLESWKKIVVCAIGVSMIVELIEIITTLLVDTVSTVLNYNNDSIENICVAVFSLGVIYIVSVVLKKNTDEGIKNISTKFLVLFTVNLLANFGILALMARVTLEEKAYNNRFIYIVIFIAVTVGMFIEMASVMLLIVSRDKYKEKELIIKQYLEEQVKQYEYLNEREKETKKFRHDIRGHLYFLNKLKQEGRDKEFEEYFQDIIGKVDNLGSIINVGNDIVNAVLNKAHAEAESKKIKMQVTGHFPSQCNISAYNLCTIFFNLLNNAIEAADKTTKREVWVVCQYTSKEIIVEIGNYYCNDKYLDKNILQTTKNEKQYHGWGIKNVEDSVADCKGLMDIEIVDEKFIVSITLKNDKEDINNENSNSR